MAMQECTAIPFSRGSSQPKDHNPGLLHCRLVLYCLSHQGIPNYTHTHSHRCVFVSRNNAYPYSV